MEKQRSFINEEIAGIITATMEDQKNQDDSICDVNLEKPLVILNQKVLQLL